MNQAISRAALPGVNSRSVVTSGFRSAKADGA